MDRRHFLQLTTGASAATLLGSRPALTFSGNRQLIEAWTAQGVPMPQEVLNQTYFLSLQDDPLPNPPRTVRDGKLWTQLPSQPVAIAFYQAIPGFGNVTLYADNQGRGYQPPDFPLNLNLACAESRIYRVRAAIATWASRGYRPSDQVESRLQRASLKLQQAQTPSSRREQAMLASESLREGLWAGELAVYEQARQHIAQHPPRPEFLWGCNFFGHPEAGDSYDRQFQALFNFATLPFYWRSFEPQPGQPNFARIDRALSWLEGAKITPKGHPLVWFHEAGVPDWIKELSYDQLCDRTQQRVTQITRHYGHRIPYYDLINEAHDIDWANILNYSPDQFLEITRLASAAAAAGYPKVQRIINACCLWAEYVPKHAYPLPKKSAYQYLQRCLEAEIPFEIIGLQLYYPSQDMFEINRLLERFGQLGRPIHITELGVSSATTPDLSSHFKTVPGLWHQPWTEAIQADWVEQFYTLCYSKPFIHAVTWWDFADGGFWPHGGLLQADLRPKDSFGRLQALRHRLLE